MLRDLLYLDMPRIESFVSQLSGGVSINFSDAETSENQNNNNGKIGFSAFSYTVGKRETKSTQFLTQKVPHHALLSLFESMLEEANLVTTISEHDAIVPGQIVRLCGETTFEGWRLVASLMDSLQNVLKFAAKIWITSKNSDDLERLIEMLKKAKKELRRKGAKDSLTAIREQVTVTEAELSKKLRTVNIVGAIVLDDYLHDVQELFKLFYQDQNRVYIRQQKHELVGVLREELVCGGTSEELMFTYGSRPSTNLETLTLVTEFAQPSELTIDAITGRFNALASQVREPSFELLQTIVREFGSLLMEFGEGLRRPSGDSLAFMTPLAIYRKVLSRQSS